MTFKRAMRARESSCAAVLAVLALVLFCAAVSVLAQTTEPSEDDPEKEEFLYEWTDKKGTIHITDSLVRVPEQYRSRVRKVESSKGQESAAVQQGQEETGVLQEASSEEAEAEAKFEWQQRMKDWRARLADAEKRYQGLERERSELLGGYGSTAYASGQARMRVEQIDQQLKELQAEIDAARNMLNHVIPEEARKAGVPPGWLRE